MRYTWFHLVKPGHTWSHPVRPGLTRCTTAKTSVCLTTQTTEERDRETIGEITQALVWLWHRLRVCLSAHFALLPQSRAGIPDKAQPSPRATDHEHFLFFFFTAPYTPNKPREAGGLVCFILTRGPKEAASLQR